MSRDADRPFDPAAIIAALDRHGVQYVLIGCAAALLHGAPTVTTDIDVVPERSEGNIGRLMACLGELGARRTTEPNVAPASPAADDLRFRIEQFDSRFGAVDVVFEATRIGGYERLVGRADRMDVDGVIVRVASLDEEIMGKQWSDRDKDRTHLRLLLAVSTRSTPALRGRVARAPVGGIRPGAAPTAPAAERQEPATSLKTAPVGSPAVARRPNGVSSAGRTTAPPSSTILVKAASASVTPK